MKHPGSSQSDPSAPVNTGELLRRVLLRPTKRRIELLEFLRRANGPCGLAEIHRQLGGDRVTLYRGLNILLESNLIHRVPTDHRTWQFAWGPTPRQWVHPHTVCRRCGAVRCMSDILDFQKLVAALNVPPEFSVQTCDVIIHGVCPSCAT